VVAIRSAAEAKEAKEKAAIRGTAANSFSSGKE
jgi:hypothetical protein